VCLLCQPIRKVLPHPVAAAPWPRAPVPGGRRGWGGHRSGGGI